MAGVLNKTARQFNLKCMDKNGHRVVVRLVPGLNDVKDNHWKVFIETKDPYVAGLKKDNLITYGKSVDDELLERDPTKSQSKTTQVVKGKKED